VYLIDMNNTKNQDQQDIFSIPTVNLPSLQKSISKLQKKAVKLGLGEIRFEVIKQYKFDVSDPGSMFEEKMSMTDVRVAGDAPIIEGWKFVASMDFSEQFGLLISKVDNDEVLPENYLLSNGDAYLCEHCFSKRLRRKAYLVRNIVTGEWKQVGSACVKDFTGHVTPAQLARYWGYLREASALSEDFTRHSREEDGLFPLHHFVTHVVAISRQWGYKSNSKAAREDGTIPTSIDVTNWIHEKAHAVLGMLSSKSAYKDLDVSKRDGKIAKEAIDWALALTEDECFNNDFLFNLKKIADAGMAPAYHLGYATAMASAYLRTIKVKEQQKQSEYYPAKVKDRVELKNLTAVFHTSWDTQFGTTHLYKFESGAYTFTWFASSGQNIYKNDVVDLKATIKNFEEYKGTKQTIITRAKIIK